MKKINNITLIEDDEITCIENKLLIEEMQVAEHVHSLDDEQMALEFLKERCSEQNGGEEQRPELIFLDLNMPFLNAYEFLDRLAACPEIAIDKLFIVLLTSSWNFRDREKAARLPVSGYLNKPLTQEKLKEVVHRFHKQYATVALRQYAQKEKAA